MPTLPAPVPPGAGPPLKLHPQAAAVEVIAIAALGCLLSIPGHARETGGPGGCAYLPRCSVSASAGKTSSFLAGVQLNRSQHPTCQHCAWQRCPPICAVYHHISAPGVVKLHKRESWRPWRQLQVDVADASILRKQPPVTSHMPFRPQPNNKHSTCCHTRHTGAHHAQTSQQELLRDQAPPCRTGPLSRVPEHLLAGFLQANKTWKSPKAGVEKQNSQ